MVGKRGRRLVGPKYAALTWTSLGMVVILKSGSSQLPIMDVLSYPT